MNVKFGIIWIFIIWLQVANLIGVLQVKKIKKQIVELQAKIVMMEIKIKQGF